MEKLLTHFSEHGDHFNVISPILSSLEDLYVCRNLDESRKIMWNFSHSARNHGGLYEGKRIQRP